MKESARKAQLEGADYLGTEAIFDTPTKQYPGGPLGLDQLKDIISEVDIPVVAIGGINSSNARQVLETSSPAGLAIVSAIISSQDPQLASSNLRNLIATSRGEDMDVLELKEQVVKAFERIKSTKPLVHHITNYVVMNDTANATLHIGASPVISDLNFVLTIIARLWLTQLRK